MLHDDLNANRTKTCTASWKRALSLAALALALLGLAPLPAQPTPLTGAPELRETLDRLNTLGSLLMLAAHPDDENTAVISYFARGRHIRTAYLSATRGEGGQNLIGPEQGELMGLIRTQELLAARRIDGGEQFFTRAIDFGYSKTPEEAFAKWGRENLLEDVVRVIRRFRPDVIVSRFPPPPGSGGHGHHTAAGYIAQEAFEAAGDPKRFSEQIEQGLQPWRAKRLLWNTYAFSREQEQAEAARQDRVKLDVGPYDPVLGRSYTEIAGESRSMHRSQGMGAEQRKGPAPAYFAHVAGVAAHDDLFEDIDTSWNRVAGGPKIGALLARARDEYQITQPDAILPLLVQAYCLLRDLDDPWARVKQQELLHAIELAAGLWLEAAAERWDATPGSRLDITLTAVNRSEFPLHWSHTAISGFSLQTEQGPGLLRNNIPAEQRVSVMVPENADLSQPAWLRLPVEGNLYRWPDPARTGEPESEPVLQAAFSFKTADGSEIVIRKPVVYRWVDSAYGERTRSLQIVPQVAVAFTRPNLIFPNEEPGQVAVVLRSNVAAASGDVSLQAPPGWKVEPPAIPFEMQRREQEITVEFTVTPTASRSGGELQARVRLGDKVIRHGMHKIEYEHIPIQMVYPEANMRVERADVQLLTKKIGYVMGAGDLVPQALEQIGAAVTLLSDADLASGDLSQYGAIVTGVRAVNTRPALVAARERVLDYVKRGGTLVVQYNTVSFRRQAGEPAVLGPYPMEPSNNRVSVEEAEVTFVNPSHALLTAPNQITKEDFAGWVQERGLYFMSEWDERYEPVLSCHDPGEPPQSGGMLYARYGDGVYIYSGYSWFRQLPAGVPGAYRIFANLVSAGAAK